ncbi:gliding motility-associated C-terminal domain-containing protein [Galbibacter sp. EGI 63066]|uniref:T9SS type B sorting domain-containing protein n=1 Tax=Galbibacter sp. EGI 63066 TaxID=2993559 RepID=UPI002248DFB2|nr:gliding motility-associated C-terminal domain-containing protein [Galbibacter sp. EGI 63066]MCX2681853.1 gliding motility-associated C-terminal domain-containing protein [Galbibacter sp. EGI 63066]
MKKIATTLGIIFSLFALNSYGQNINAPQLKFEYACLNESFNSYEANFSFTDALFNSDNTFYIELSDKNGNFDNPTVLKSVTTENYSYEFTEEFSFPESVAGENYKIRLRSTSPAMVGESTAAFDAFFVPNVALVLNNYDDVSLCGNSSAILKLNDDVAAEYVWYKDGALHTVTTENQLEVTEPGDYYAEPYYGNCTGQIYSNLVIVTEGESFDISILGNKSIEACSDTSVVLEASIDNENYVYTWYKDDVKIEGLSGYAPQLTLDAETNNYGSYMLEVTNENGCTSASSPVSIEQNKSTVVEAASPLNAVIIGDNTATLAIETNDTTADINWYKDGILIEEAYNELSIVVNDEGTYYAEVASASTCDGVVESSTFNVYEPVSFTAEINTQNQYKSCDSQSVVIELSALKGTLSNDDVITIDEGFFHNFDMKWIKDGKFTAMTDASLSLDYTDNGTYQLELTYEDQTFTSNEYEVVLGLPQMSVNISEPMSCVDAQAQLSATKIEGAVYTWYHNGEMVASGSGNTFTASETGSYEVEVSYGGCSTISEAVTIEQDTEGLISVYPGEEITITQDRTVEANATGGDRYEWIDASGTVVSTTSLMSFTDEGTYSLIAYIGECTVEKTIEVVSNNVVAVPNIISPNNDSINDKWTLPAKYVNDPDTEVVIRDSYGSTILKTNKYDNNWPNASTKTSAETAVYYYFINKKGEDIKKGSITLVN